MIFAIATLLIKIFAIDFDKAVRIARFVFIGLLLLILLAVGLFLRSCLAKQPKLDEETIRAAQQAIAENDRKVMVEILTNSDVAEKQIDGNLANAKAATVNAINEAKKNAEAMSNEELAAELERRK